METSTGLDPVQQHRQRLEHRVAGWSARLRSMGLNDVVGALLDAAEPFGPLGAQMLWVAQPALGLFMASDEVDGLARVLDDPLGMAWLRSELSGADCANCANSGDENA
jgi:hypothetical protein